MEGYAAGMAHVATAGTFDLFHPGHVWFLSQCAKIATPDGKVTVILNRDEFVARYKGEPPTMSYDERATMLRACRHVDEVVENHRDERCGDVVCEMFPDFLVIGQDWARMDYYAQMGVTQDDLDASGISLLYVPRPEDGTSSTELRARAARHTP